MLSVLMLTCMALCLNTVPAWGGTVSIYSNTGETGTTVDGITASGNINSNNGNSAPSFGLTSSSNKTVTLSGFILSSYTNVKMTLDFKPAKSGTTYSSLVITQYDSSNKTIGSAYTIKGTDNSKFTNYSVDVASTCCKITLVLTPAGSTYNSFVDNIMVSGEASSSVTYTEVLLSQSWLSLINYSIRQRSFALRAPQLWFLGLSLVWHIVLTDTKKQQAELTAYRIDDFLLYPCIGTKFTRLVSPTSAPA